MIAGEGPTQNLINQSKITAIEKPPGFYKSIVLDFFAVLSAGVFGFAYYRYLESNLSLWWLLGALALWSVLSVLELFLTSNLSRRLVILFLEVVALLGFFYRDQLGIILVAAGVVYLFLLWGYLGGRSMLNNGIEIQFFRTTGTMLGKLVTATLLFMILIYVPQFNSNSVFVSRQGFREFFDWGAGLISDIYPNFSANNSFSTFAQSVATTELQNNPSFQSLTPEQQSSTISQETTQLENTFGAPTSGSATSSAPTSDAFYNFIVGMLQAWQAEGPTWFIVGWAVVLFLALRTLGILFVWVAQFISLIFYEILLATGFMKISESTQTKENIGY